MWAAAAAVWLADGRPQREEPVADEEDPKRKCVKERHSEEIGPAGLSTRAASHQSTSWTGRCPGAAPLYLSSSLVRSHRCDISFIRRCVTIEWKFILFSLFNDFQKGTSSSVISRWLKYPQEGAKDETLRTLQKKTLRRFWHQKMGQDESLGCGALEKLIVFFFKTCDASSGAWKWMGGLATEEEEEAELN